MAYHVGLWCVCLCASGCVRACMCVTARVNARATAHVWVGVGGGCPGIGVTMYFFERDIIKYPVQPLVKLAIKSDLYLNFYSLMFYSFSIGPNEIQKEWVRVTKRQQGGGGGLPIQLIRQGPGANESRRQRFHCLSNLLIFLHCQSITRSL